MPIKVSTRFIEDKSNYRTGWVLDEDITKMMIKCAVDARAVIHKDQVAKKIPLTEKMLLDQIDAMRTALEMAYPGFKGLGEWEPARVISESKELEAFYNKADLDVSSEVIVVYRGGNSNDMVCREGNVKREEAV